MLRSFVDLCVLLLCLICCLLCSGDNKDIHIHYLLIIFDSVLLMKSSKPHLCYNVYNCQSVVFLRFYQVVRNAHKRLSDVGTFIMNECDSY